MYIIFSLISILFSLAMLVGFVFLLLFIARKFGFITQSSPNGIEGEQSGLKSYLADFKRLNQSLMFRFGLISLLVILMNSPLSMVSDIVEERSQLYSNVLSGIANTWGHTQKLQGPALLIPYTEKFISVKVLTDKDGNERKVNQTIYEHHIAIILPEDLNIDADLLSRSLNRGIYDALVYTADLNITGSFQRPDINKLSNHIDEVHWDRAWLTLGISDTQAINNVSSLHWQTNEQNTSNIDFEPGTRIVDTISNGFHAPIDLSSNDLPLNKTIYNFSLNIDTNGSQGFYFAPFGKVTNVNISSDWPHPSFQGNILPDHRKVADTGFKASWSVPNLARNYPQIWTLKSQEFNLDEFSAGVNLFESVSLYSKITRAIKYGSLFFILTYITFLIFELAIGKRLHIVQYGIIGLALSMFYLTLLSMAEHAGFFRAYLSAASIIITMVSLYVYAAMRSIGSAAIIGILLSGLYFMLYTMLKLEEHALLSGTVLLLVILAVMMYLTRNMGKEKT
jgi:inner membrane protein